MPGHHMGEEFSRCCQAPIQRDHCQIRVMLPRRADLSAVLSEIGFRAGCIGEMGRKWALRVEIKSRLTHMG